MDDDGVRLSVSLCCDVSISVCVHDEVHWCSIMRPHALASGEVKISEYTCKHVIQACMHACECVCASVFRVCLSG